MIHPQQKQRRRKKQSLSKKTNFQGSPPKSIPVVRLLLVWAVLVMAAIALGWKLYELQVVQGEELRKKARQQQMRSVSIYTPRRAIVDRHNNVLASDLLLFSLYAHPIMFKIPQEEMAAKLEKIIPALNTEELLKRFESQKTGIRISTEVTESEALQVRKLYQDGLELERRYARIYPQEDVTADIVGYVNGERRGQAGVEYSHQNLLSRSPLTIPLNITGRGRLMPTHMPEGLLDFDDLRLQLTLDLRLQRAARAALKAQIAKYEAARGAVLVMDALDGSLLALVCEPTYNPNQYHEFDLALLKNWAIADQYEPGSTLKPINVALALEAGVIEANDTFNDTGRIIIDRAAISNHDFYSRGGRGYIDIPQILQYSSNVGMIKIAQRMSRKAYYESLKRLEIQERTGIDLPGETPGYLKPEQIFTRAWIEAAAASFGQGLSLTPLKLVQLHGAIANGGKLVTPHAVKGLVDTEGQFHWQPTLRNKDIFSGKTSQTVLEMMETVVTKGSGKVAAIPGYRIGGKTGTAQKASPYGGYMENAKITSFVATLPVDSPRYVVLAVVDEPQGPNTFGSTVAAPIVKSVIEALIAIEKIPPSTTINYD